MKVPHTAFGCTENEMRTEDNGSGSLPPKDQSSPRDPTCNHNLLTQRRTTRRAQAAKHGQSEAQPIMEEQQSKLHKSARHRRTSRHKHQRRRMERRLCTKTLLFQSSQADDNHTRKRQPLHPLKIATTRRTCPRACACASGCRGKGCLFARLCR